MNMHIIYSISSLDLKIIYHNVKNVEASVCVHPIFNSVSLFHSFITILYVFSFCKQRKP